MPWRVLVVDDDADVHAVTKLVLKKKSWRNQRFELTGARSKAEAVTLLKEGHEFHVALIDVVMEEEGAGLELCELIRDRCPRSTRIVLRTGQPGLVPEEEILNDYDIDYYMNKADISPERLFSVVRACLRSSQDISTLLAYGRQLQSFTRTLQYVSTVEDLVVFMGEALGFLELKHHCKTVFAYDLTRDEDAIISEGRLDYLTKAECVRALMNAHERAAELMTEHHGRDLGLSDADFGILFEAREENLGKTAIRDSTPIPGGIIFSMNSEVVSAKSRRDLASDAKLFIENWCIAFSTLRLRERLSQEQNLRSQMYQERLESIATMVAGVAHELNTPLGVARTAGSMVSELTREIIDGISNAEAEFSEEAADLQESVRLMNKNLDRAHKMIQSFRQLSASQLSDECVEADIKGIIEDCMETMGPDLRRSGINANVHPNYGEGCRWIGYPGHLSQVIINLTQNAIRYAYDPGVGGALDITIEGSGDGFLVRFTDYGKGVSDEIKPRMFDAFVTSGREIGGTGLGLAIVQNIVTNLLGGDITCESSLGEGTIFEIRLPAVCRIESDTSPV
ncbi:ATP-binding protein [Streptomyces sp. NPDC015127]|uniref:ATP-binding protein n=1 Tax=Streptomyces sp. NPDC015127 TaxID=3364939 RepID=UPI0036FE53AE